jgi:hypothetical protein
MFSSDTKSPSTTLRAPTPQDAATTSQKNAPAVNLAWNRLAVSSASDSELSTKGTGANALGQVNALTGIDPHDTRAIIDMQKQIVEQWQNALTSFKDAMGSEANAATTPDFQKTISGFIIENLKSIGIAALDKFAGGGMSGKVIELITELDAETTRAQAASGASTLSDFIQQYSNDLQKIEDQLEISKPKITGVIFTQKYVDPKAYEALISLEKHIRSRLTESTPERLFGSVIALWINSFTVRPGVRSPSEARVMIWLNHDGTVRGGMLKVQGGQKLAEKWLQQEPSGIDLYAMPVPRTIARYPEGRNFPESIVYLDQYNRLENTGAFAEGNYMHLFHWLQSNKLPKVKIISGE